MRRFVNAFELPGKWYKGNFHAHSRTSDGALWPQDVVKCYRDHGFSVIALTDHEHTNDIRGLSDDKILVINGMEVHPPFPKRKGNYHLVALNLPHRFPIARRSQQDVQSCLDQVARAGGLSILGHPRELSTELSEFVNLKRLTGLEVWTALSEVDGSCGSSEREWAEAMDHGTFLSAIGSDDVHWAPRHGLREAYAGWTWLKMRSLTVANVLKAIRTGACYASGGPTIHDFRLADGKMRLRCSPAAWIDFKSIGDERRRRIAPAGKTIRSFVIDVPDWPFVRAVVTDTAGKQAWSNPLHLPRGRKAPAKKR